MSEELVFGVGEFIIGGTSLMYLQEATVTFDAENQVIYKKSVTPYTSYIEYPVDNITLSRNITISARHAKINMEGLYQVLGGSLSSYGGGTNNRLTINKDSDIPTGTLYLKNPSDGSELELYFPKVKSLGKLDFTVIQDDYVVIEPEFIALWDEITSVICRITQP